MHVNYQRPQLAAFLFLSSNAQHKIAFLYAFTWKNAKKIAGPERPSGLSSNYTGNLNLLGAMAAESLQVQTRDHLGNVKVNPEHERHASAASGSYNMQIESNRMESMHGALPYNNNSELGMAPIQIHHSQEVSYTTHSAEASPKKHRDQSELSRSFVSSDGGFSCDNSAQWMPVSTPPAFGAKEPSWEPIPVVDNTGTQATEEMLRLVGSHFRKRDHGHSTMTTSNSKSHVETAPKRLRHQDELPRNYPMAESGLHSRLHPEEFASRTTKAANTASSSSSRSAVSAGTPKSFLEFCAGCNKATPHTTRRFSVHCRDERNIRNTYMCSTCRHCGRETSVCPNHESGEFNHPDRNIRLLWRRLPSQHTSERVWEMECKACVQERYIRKNLEKRTGRHAEVSRKLAKLTTKWTRCNRCKALYKKGKGVKGVHSSDKCKVLGPAAGSATTPPPTPSSPTAPSAPSLSILTGQRNVVEIIKTLLANKEFASISPSLRDQVLQQCRESSN